MKKDSLKLFWCLFFVYTINVLGKTSFSAATAALIDEAVVTKTQAGIISGCFWMLYAIGQFVGGFIASRMSAYVMINITICGSVITNLLMAFSGGFIYMLVVWSIAGVIQFGMWPAVLKIVSTEIIMEQRTRAMERLAFCYCSGSIISYAITTVILLTLSWRHIFYISAFINGISLPIALYAGWKLSPVLRQQEKPTGKISGRKERLTWSIVWKSELVFFCILMLIKGITDTGIKSWMPTIMLETYGTAPGYTSLLSVGLLFTNIFGVVLCTKIYEKVKSDELVTLRILYLITMPMMLLLLFFESMNIYIATILLSGITVLIYGSGQTLQMNYPGRFWVYGQTAAVGGIINCFAALGNVIATYGSGYIADNFGWNTMIVIWNVLIILFVLLTVLMIPMWKKFRWNYC